MGKAVKENRKEENCGTEKTAKKLLRKKKSTSSISRPVTMVISNSSATEKIFAYLVAVDIQNRDHKKCKKIEKGTFCLYLVFRLLSAPLCGK